MINKQSFREWLENNTDYSKRVINDQVSRMSRADAIYAWSGQETYLFYLEKEPTFLELSVSVRSQLRKSAKLYMKYAETIFTEESNITSD